MDTLHKLDNSLLDHFSSKHKQQRSWLENMHSITMGKDERWFGLELTAAGFITSAVIIKQACVEQAGGKWRSSRSKKEILKGYESGNVVTNAWCHDGASDRLYTRKIGLVFIGFAALRAFAGGSALCLMQSSLQLRGAHVSTYAKEFTRCAFLMFTGFAYLPEHLREHARILSTFFKCSCVA